MSSLKVEVDPTSFGFSFERLERIGEHFNRYVDDRRLPGWLATISRGGELVWSDKGGYRDRERGLSVEDDTIWRIYSMTKPITAVAVMMLYEEGRFDLNDEVGQWIEELREPRVWSGGTAAAPETVAASEPVRVHHLLMHTSGLTYGFNYRHPVDEIYRAKGYDFGFARGADLAQAVADWSTSPLLFQPGSRWNYSVSFDVLGRLIEIWSGQTLDVFFRNEYWIRSEWWIRSGGARKKSSIASRCSTFRRRDSRFPSRTWRMARCTRRAFSVAAEACCRRRRTTSALWPCCSVAVSLTAYACCRVARSIS